MTFEYTPLLIWLVSMVMCRLFSRRMFWIEVLQDAQNEYFFPQLGLIDLNILSTSMVITYFRKKKKDSWLILVCLNKIPQTGGLSDRDLFYLLEARSPRSRCHQGGCLVRPLFLAYRQLPFHCVFTWPLLWVHGERHTQRERSLVSLIIRTPVLSN